MRPTRPLLAATTVVAIALLTGCATAATDPGTEPVAPPTVASSPSASSTPIQDPWSAVRRQGMAIYQVVDAELLGETLGMPRGDSLIDDGADLSLDDGDFIAVRPFQYGESVTLWILDEDTNDAAEPLAELVFWLDDPEELVEAGAVWLVPRS